MIIDTLYYNSRDVEFVFSDDVWVHIDLADECYEYMVGEELSTYISGKLEIRDSCYLIGYDGCSKLPTEVIDACKTMGLTPELD